MTPRLEPWNTPGSRYHSRQFRPRASFDRNQVNVEDLRIATSGGEITAAGGVNGFADPELKLNILAGVDLVPLLELAGVSLSRPVSGQIQAAIPNE